MSLLDILLGKPLGTYEERAEQLGVSAGIPIFGLDALSSAAYGPEAALTLLIGLGAAGIHYIFPVSICIIALLTIVFFSYRQTIAAYPGGGRSYTVASQNLGAFPGLLAGSALMIDYILVVAIGISAGVGALVSAVPRLQPHTLGICLAILMVITIVNLRGVRETQDETKTLKKNWPSLVEAPVKQIGGNPPQLVTLSSPFRFVLKPVLEYVHDLEEQNPHRQIAVIIPEFVEKHWYHYPLHNQRAELLKALILLQGGKQIVLINVPWYLKA